MNPALKWRERLIPFLRDVWPYHRSVRTPEMSARLTDLALGSGDQFASVVATIGARLVPVRGGTLRGFLEGTDFTEDNPARLFPKAMLDLLWAILAEDSKFWPYKAEDVLQLLAEAPETLGDPRLSELRRRRSA